MKANCGKLVCLLALIVGGITAQSQPVDQPVPVPNAQPADVQPGPPPGTPDAGPMQPGGDQPGPDNNGGPGGDAAFGGGAPGGNSGPGTGGGGEVTVSDQPAVAGGGNDNPVGGFNGSSRSFRSGPTARSRRSTSGPTVTLVPPQAYSGAKGDKLLRLNFRKAPLDQVLNYLSDAAGFVILLESELRGAIDVWSNQALTPPEAVALLDTVLDKSGYGVILDGHFLTVVSRNDAQRRDHPIKTGNSPGDIPKNAQVVTQIIPVRSLNATQLLKDLAPLLPTDTTLTANEAGNSLIMTDTQFNIHRVAEIIKALDSISSSVNSIRVFPLQYADAKTTVTVVKELFPSQNSTTSGNNNQAGGGFPFPGGFGGAPNNNNSAANANSSSQKPSTRVLAVADENSNAVVVSAPEDIQSMIGDLIKSIDINVNDIAEMKVFPLKNADPTEMATLLSSLFPDDSTSSNNNNRFGGGPAGGGPFAMANSQQGQTTSDRAKRKGKVLAVADARTASVVVNCDKSLMPGIGAIVKQLDADSAKKQKVYVYSLQNADVASVQQVLNDLFQRNTSSSTSQNNDALATRSTTMQQQQQQSAFGSGSTSSGSRNGGF